MYSQKEIVHFTDLSFFQLCEGKFGINRGVYNTIESWFYHKGIKDILKRRKTILHFLEWIGTTFDNKKCRKKFGHGGLSSQLDYYWQKNGFPLDPYEIKMKVGVGIEKKIIDKW